MLFLKDTCIFNNLVLYLFEIAKKFFKSKYRIKLTSKTRKEITKMKISIIGAGNVGATVAYTLTIDGMASEIVLVDINENKAKGEAMDIRQGTAFCPPVDIYAGGYSEIVDSDIVVVTSGLPRKDGQTRLDLAQSNINLMKEMGPELVKYAPDAIYVVVSNPVDIMTYALLKTTGLPENQVIGSGTILDSARLRSNISRSLDINPQNVHSYVFGEHGDSSFVPWSLASVSGMPLEAYYKERCKYDSYFCNVDFDTYEESVRTSGSKIISKKGATYYAIALSVRRICDCIVRDTNSVLTVSSMIHDRYGISDVCLSLPFVLGRSGIKDVVSPPILPEEQEELKHSYNVIKNMIDTLDI